MTSEAAQNLLDKFQKAISDLADILFLYYPIMLNNTEYKKQSIMR